jgi:hypothetical protein
MLNDVDMGVEGARCSCGFGAGALRLNEILSGNSSISSFLIIFRFIFSVRIDAKHAHFVHHIELGNQHERRGDGVEQQKRVVAALVSVSVDRDCNDVQDDGNHRQKLTRPERRLENEQQCENRNYTRSIVCDSQDIDSIAPMPSNRPLRPAACCCPDRASLCSSETT